MFGRLGGSKVAQCEECCYNHHNELNINFLTKDHTLTVGESDMEN